MKRTIMITGMIVLLCLAGCKTKEESTDTKEANTMSIEEIKKMIITADEAVCMEMDMKNVQKITEEELTKKLSDYFDEEMLDYLIFMYQFQKNGEFLTRSRYDNYINFWLDREGEMSILEQHENNIVVEVSFKHRWRMLAYDKGIITLSKNENGKWLISSITQWYNDFKYRYMREYDFNPQNFTEEMAEMLIRYFGSDETGEIVTFDTALSRQGFVIETSSDQLLVEEDISNLSKFEIFLAVQEIYARHGKKFEDDVLYEYFGRQDWYQPYDIIFAEDLLTEVEKKNLQFLAEGGKLEQELASPSYGCLYPVYKSKPKELTAEETCCIVYKAFHAAEEIMVVDEDMISEELSDDVIKLYQQKYDTQQLKEYLSEYFSDELFTYLIKIFGAMHSLWYNEEDQKYYVSREGTLAYDRYIVDYYRNFEIIWQDEDMCIISVPFLFEVTSDPVEDRGEMVLRKNKQGKWIIDDISLEYYNQIFEKDTD